MLRLLRAVRVTEQAIVAHTPAPWRAYHTPDDTWIVDQPGSSGLHVVSCGPNTNQHSAANANLIAAAPDLLNVVRGFVEWFETQGTPDSTVLYEAGLAAMHKATGATQ